MKKRSLLCAMFFAMCASVMACGSTETTSTKTEETTVAKTEETTVAKTEGITTAEVEETIIEETKEEDPVEKLINELLCGHQFGETSNQTKSIGDAPVQLPEFKALTEKSFAKYKYNSNGKLTTVESCYSNVIKVDFSEKIFEYYNDPDEYKGMIDEVKDYFTGILGKPGDEDDRYERTINWYIDDKKISVEYLAEMYYNHGESKICTQVLTLSVSCDSVE